jgi:hypothetical protein
MILDWRPYARFSLNWSLRAPAVVPTPASWCRFDFLALSHFRHGFFSVDSCRWRLVWLYKVSDSTISLLFTHKYI